MLRLQCLCCLLGFHLFVSAQPPVPDVNGMTNAVVNGKNELKIDPSPASDKRDFDFFYGTWKVSGRKLKTRLHHSDEWINFSATLKCTGILDHQGNAEPFYTTKDGKPFEAFTLRLFNTKSRLWSIYYAWPDDVTLQNPQVGSFQGNIGWFYARDTWENIPIIIVYRWDRTDADKPTMCQAFSTDNGKTWEWNYLQSFERIKE